MVTWEQEYYTESRDVIPFTLVFALLFVVSPIHYHPFHVSWSRACCCSAVRRGVGAGQRLEEELRELQTKLDKASQRAGELDREVQDCQRRCVTTAVVT